MILVCSQFTDCARCQILLSDPSDPTIFKRVFDMTKHESTALACGIGNNNQSSSQENKCYFGQKHAMPVNASIASEVARTGQKVNLRNLPLGEDDDE